MQESTRSEVCKQASNYDIMLLFPIATSSVQFVFFFGKFLFPFVRVRLFTSFPFFGTVYPVYRTLVLWPFIVQFSRIPRFLLFILSF